MEEIKNTEPTTEIKQETAPKAAPETVPEKEVKSEPKKPFMERVEAKLTRKTVWGLIGEILLILIVIPEAFLLLCGLIFDKWLKLYELTTVIFIVWAIIIIIAIILTVKSIIWYVKAKKKA